MQEMVATVETVVDKDIEIRTHIRNPNWSGIPNMDEVFTTTAPVTGVLWDNITSQDLFPNQTTKNHGIYDFYQEEQVSFLIFLFVAIVVGNLTVLIATGLSKRGQRSRMTFFIMHLALADLFVGVVSVLTDLVWKITLQWYAGDVMCKLVRYFQAVVTYSSTYILVSLSIDRLDAIARPMSFTSSSVRGKVLVGAAWLCSAVFSLPMLFINRLVTLKDGSLQCWISFPMNWYWKLYVSVIASILFFIPTLIIALCYFVILYVIWRKSKTLTTGNPSNRVSLIKRLPSRHNGSAREPPDEQRKLSKSSSRGIIPQAKIRTIKMTLVIVIVFIMCWSPYFVYQIVDVFGYLPHSQTKYAVGVLFQSLAPLNSVANPFIYGIFSSRICRNLRRIRVCNYFISKCCCWCPGLDARPERSGSTYSSSLPTYTTAMAEEYNRNPFVHSRRQSGPPCVKDNLSEKETEILMKNLSINKVAGASCRSNVDI